MHQSAYAAARSFQTRFEGRFRWPYLDCLGKVTVGIGCLIDSVDAAMRLNWKLTDGNPASRPEIVAQWHDVKAQTRLAAIGAKYAESVTKLRLTEADVDQLFDIRVSQFVTELQKYFPGWDLFPADAQLGILSMAWAMGPAFARKFPKFTAAANAQDWATAVEECTIDGEDKNVGLKPRNAANRILFGNAAAVRFDFVHASGRAHALQVSELYYPLELTVPS